MGDSTRYTVILLCYNLTSAPATWKCTLRRGMEGRPSPTPSRRPPLCSPMDLTWQGGS